MNTNSILFRFAQPNRKHFYYKKKRQVTQQVMEGPPAMIEFIYKSLSRRHTEYRLQAKEYKKSNLIKHLKEIHDIAWLSKSRENFYSRTSTKQPSSIKRPFSKVPNYLSAKCCIRYLFSTATSIKRPRPPFFCCKFSISCFFLSLLSGQQMKYIFKGNGGR